MTKKKYVLLTSGGEPNIAVLEVINHKKIQTDADLEKELSAKLALALTEHFDEEVTLTEFKYRSSIPITGSVLAQLEDYSFTIDINETWVY